MRIGVDYRILSVGGEYIHRGMGRYTQEQLREVLRIDCDNDYILLCNEGADQSLILPEIRQAPNTSIRPIPQRLMTSDQAGTGLLVEADRYQDWLAEQQLDVYHATTPFYDTPPIVPVFDVCALVTTLYDLIPLIFPHHYQLHENAFSHRYLLAAGLLTRADRVVAISHSAKHDAETYLGLQSDRFEVAWPTASPCFRPMPRALAIRSLAALRSRMQLPERFALAVTASHHSKNIEKTLEAYSRLAPSARTRLPLVLGGHLPDPMSLLDRLVRRFDIRDDVIFTGLISDDQLAALYNLATFVIHHSRYEGFGLPVLEAMSCGTPTITSTTSSLPEVAGDAAVLVDPDDIHGLVAAMEELVDDGERRALMRSRGLERARLFSGDQLGQATLRSYRSAATRPGAARRRRLALWTPLPPQQSGIADFSTELMGALAPEFEIEAFVDDGVEPPANFMLRHRVHHHSAHRRRHRQDPFDIALYQLGASSFHSYMYEQLQAQPGLVDLHDLSWNHVLLNESVRRGTRAEFEQAVLELEGDAALRRLDGIRAPGVENADELMRAFLEDHLMLGRVIDASLGQIVHYPDARRVLESRYPRARVHVIPMGVADPYRPGERAGAAGARVAAGLPPGSFVVGVFGAVHPIKRIDSCLRAFRQLLCSEPDSLMVVVGPVTDSGHQEHLTGLAAELGVGERVRFTGRLSRRRFDAHLTGCDVVVNLRFPTHRQMSAIVVRAAAAAKPIIVSDIPDWAFIPDGFCLRVAPDEAEVDTLACGLRRLARDRGLRAGMASAARAFYQAEGTLHLMASRYLQVIKDLT